MSKFIIFFIFIPLVYSELHRFISTYTGINGQTAAGTPEFSAVTTLDGRQIDYYDSIINELIPKQAWMKEYASTEMWKEDTEIRKHVHQIYRNNIHVLMQRLNQTHGVHVYQRSYGCEWDDVTGHSHGFDEYGYDGEDFISLDLKENRYITPVQQGLTTMMKWNSNRELLTSLKEYYDYECVYWLKELLHLSKSATEKTEPPEVSLLQKIYVECHVTGFLFRDTNISWWKNGQAMSDSSKLYYGDTLPNEDGTFQRTLTLYIRPDEWKKDRYTCVVEHKSWSIQKILTEDHINASFVMNLVLVFIPVIVGLIGLIGLCVHLKLCRKLKACNKKNCKTKHSPDHAQSRESLVFTSSNESSSPSVVSDPSVSGSSWSLHRDEQNHSPEPSPTTTRTFYEDQETSKDL